MRKKTIYMSFISFISLIILSTILIVSIIKINIWKKDNEKNDAIQKELQKTAIISNEEISKDENSNDDSDYKINFDTLKKINSDVVGWLEVPGTNINYSLVQTNNNDYYLSHNFNKEINSSGWIFVDYNNKFDGTDKNIVIYGHNVKDNSMFGSLKNVITESWYNNEENYNIVLITEKTREIYRVFSVYEIKIEDYYIQTSFPSQNTFEDFISTIKKRSIKNFEEQVTAKDTILTLSTCANNNNYRIVLHAKKI